jgi:indolepyruvate ferredoxin oxidoreductase, beta subunit
MVNTTTKEINILICGVGGQGVVSMSELLGNAAVCAGQSVKGSEVLGMAQRGGSVMSNIRIGEDAVAPLTPETKCNVLLAVEPSEVLHYMGYLNKDSLVILNIRKVVPYTVTLGQSKYPDIETIMNKLNAAGVKVVQIDAAEMAVKAGDFRTTNVVMLGALFGSGQVPVEIKTIKNIIGERFPSKIAEINYRAFDLGYDLISSAL